MKKNEIRETLLAKSMSCASVDWESLNGKIVAVSGATGLIGSFIVDLLLKGANQYNLDIKMALLVRDIDRARSRFPDSRCIFYKWNAACPTTPNVQADYVIHLACETSSAGFIERPVETISEVIDGCRSMLELALKSNARVCVASTMEVYGAGGAYLLTEDMGGSLDSMNPRNSYPEAKQLAECLAASYASEFGIHVCVARLCQTFGVGVRPDDTRVFAEFARKCLAGEDIVLFTLGEKRNMYLSVQDAATAILTLLTRGQGGLAYNVANEKTYCSVREMAEIVIREFGAADATVHIQVDHEAAKRFRMPGNVMQDTTRIRKIGWEPTGDLLEIYRQMMLSWGKYGC